MTRLRDVFVCTLLGAAAGILLYIQVRSAIPGPTVQPNNKQPREDQSLKALGFKKERDRLSKLLNDLKKEHGQLSCENIKLKKKSGDKKTSDVSETGGWCYDVSKAESKTHYLDLGFAAALADFFTGKSVASFGDGPGEYKRLLDKSKKLKVYDAYDGAPYCEIVTNNTVKFLDLTAPQYGLPVYDWVSSVEVAEHIPAKYQDIYLDNIVRHARGGVLLSWAVPGQTGFSHVNPKTLTQVKAIMTALGFEIDMESSKKLQNAAKFSWLRTNVFVYKRLPANKVCLDTA